MHDSPSNSPIKAPPATTDVRSSETREHTCIPSTEPVHSATDEKMNNINELRTMVTALINQAEKESETNATAVQELYVQLSKLLITSLDEKAKRSLFKEMGSKAFPKVTVNEKVNQLEKKMKFIESIFSKQREESKEEEAC